MDRQTAAERLAYGDDASERLDPARAEDVAADDAVSVEFVEKAIWLSRRYSNAEREALGADVLTALSPSHLEVVATIDPQIRLQVLRRASTERLTVRDLKKLARDRVLPSSATKIGAADDLTSACRALEIYADWSDADLDRLIAGPNGTAIKALAVAGRELAGRLDDAMVGS